MLPRPPPLPAIAALLLGLGACAALEPQATAQSVAPAPTPPPAAAAPAAVEPAMPALALAPRDRWTRIRIDPRSNIVQAWLASPAVQMPEGHMRRWVVANLKESIPIPETGGRAVSVAFIADYHCEKHAWDPVETIWFARRDAQQQVLRERPRGPGEREVARGTLVDVFLDAACAAAAKPRQPRRH